MIAKYLVLDCEMGGIGLDTSLLTVCIDKLDKDLNKVDRLYIQAKPDDGIYHVTPMGMHINGIDLKTHDDDKKTLPYRKWGTAIHDYLNSEGGRSEDDKYRVVGHQVHGDLSHIWDKLIRRATWEGFCSYRLIDTSPIASFCVLTGIIKLSDEVIASGNFSLGVLAKHFGLGEQPKVGHTCEHDVDLTAGVFRELIKAGKAVAEKAWMYQDLSH